MNKKLLGWIIFVVIVLSIIGYIALKQSGNDDHQLRYPEEGEDQIPQEDLASTDLSASDDDFAAIDEGLEGLN